MSGRCGCRMAVKTTTEYPPSRHLHNFLRVRTPPLPFAHPPRPTQPIARVLLPSACRDRPALAHAANHAAPRCGAWFVFCGLLCFPLLFSATRSYFPHSHPTCPIFSTHSFDGPFPSAMAPTYQPSNGYGVQGPNGYAHADQEQRPHDEPVGPDAQTHRDDPSRGPPCPKWLENKKSGRKSAKSGAEGRKGTCMRERTTVCQQSRQVS